MAEWFTQGYALLICVNENAVPQWALPDVAKDVAAMKQVLIHPQRCAYPEDHVEVLQGSAATRQGILDALARLQQRIDKDTSGNATAVVYFSGHGWRNTTAGTPSYYLIPQDVKAQSVSSRALRVEDFAAEIQALQPRRLLVVLDCCHAGGMEVKDIAPLAAGFDESAIPAQLFAAGAAGASTAEGAKGLEQLAQGAGRAVLSSSQGDQRSYIRHDRQMSIFTYHLIEALTGHAPPQSGAGEVLVSDVMSHVSRRVPQSAQAEYGQPQVPDYFVDGNFPIALLLGGKGLAKGEPAPDPLAPLEDRGAGPVTVNTGGGAHIGGNVTVGGDFVGHDKVVHGDEVRGDKVMGDKITTGNISGTGIAVGRGARVSVHQGLSGSELDLIFSPLTRALQAAPPGARDEAARVAQDLREEAGKGTQADDNRVAKLIDKLVDLVPGAVSAVVSVFATPILSGLAGNATRFVLDKLQGK
jgi:hypothetical protein